MNEARWSRRRALGAGGAFALAGCQTPARDGALLTVNLADVGPPPPASPPTPGQALSGQALPADAAQLETAFDQALRMTVPVYINGTGPFAFVVDTGANRSVLALELAQRLGLENIGTAEVHGIAGVEPAPLFRTRLLRLGAVYSTNLSLPGAPGDRLGAEGLVGVDVLRDRKVTLGFAANEFYISPSVLRGAVSRGGGTRLPDPQHTVTVPARYRFGQLIIVDAEIGGIPVTAFLDSGSQITIGNPALRQAILRAQPGLIDRFVEAPLISATGQVARGEFASLPPLRLGGMLVQHLSGVFASLHIFDLWDLKEQPALLIGVDVLRQFTSVELDFGRREVTFTPMRARRRS